MAGGRGVATTLPAASGHGRLNSVMHTRSPIWGTDLTELNTRQGASASRVAI